MAKQRQRRGYNDRKSFSREIIQRFLSETDYDQFCEDYEAAKLVFGGGTRNFANLLRDQIEHGVNKDLINAYWQYLDGDLSTYDFAEIAADIIYERKLGETSHQPSHYAQRGVAIVGAYLANEWRNKNKK